MNQCIILNGNYTFLNTVSWRRGLILVLKGKTEVLKTSGKFFQCVDGSKIPIPLVIKLIKVIRMIYRNRVPYSKRNIMARDRHECVYCGNQNELTIDHMIPTSRGGKTNFENCVTACRSCNNKKSDRTPNEAKMFLKRQPYAPTISEFLRIKMKSLGVDKFLKDIGVF